MNLIKLFNFKFMKQMLKKAKGQLIIFLLLVPIFTFLRLLVIYSGNTGGVLDYTSISIINFIGMYVIPVILSINLFNFIYKRASVDFINSMPINKKTIFCSNVLLGIILIIVMQLVNVLGILVFCAFKPEIVLFKELIWDSFIMTTISYIFVFAATNLAMCLSGNVITQIIMTCLIVFFVPFFMNNLNNNMFDMDIGGYVLELDGPVLNGNENIQLMKFDMYNETMPYRTLKCMFCYGVSLYNSISIIKMFVLSIVYTAIGAILFEKRKFENLGESFRDIKIHQIVKALTMFPMFALINKLNLLECDIEVILLVYALLIAYFVIYDIITAKKNKFKTTLISIVVVFLALNGITLGIDKMISKRPAKFYSLDDIKSVSIDMEGYRRYYSDILDYEITDKKIIEMILRNNISIPSTVKVRLNDGEELFADRTFTSLDKTDYDRERFINEICKDEGYKNKLIELKLTNGYYTLRNDIKVTGNFEKEIDKIITEYQKNNVNVLENVDTEYWFEIEKHYYENHQIMSEKYLIKNNEIKTKIAQIYNKDMLDGLKNRNEDDYAWFNMFDNSISRHAYFNDEDFDKIKKLILNDDNEIDFNKRYVVVSFNNGSTRKEHFYVTDNEELYRIYLDKVNKDYRDEYYYKDPEVTLEYVEEIDNTVVNEIN